MREARKERTVREDRERSQVMRRWSLREEAGV
jgi:hypothetical protein